VIWGSDRPKQKYKYGRKKPDQTPGETGPNQNKRDVRNNNLFETKEPNHGTLAPFIIRYRYRYIEKDLNIYNPNHEAPS
jgi:hypothetical protein